MPTTSTVSGVKSFFDVEMRYILQTTKDKLLFSNEHMHTFYEIVYVLAGRCIHKVCGKPLEMEEGDFIIIRPQSNHAIISADKGTDILCISLSKEEYLKYELLYNMPLATKNDSKRSLVRLPSQIRYALIELLQGENIYNDNDIRAICSVLFSGCANSADKTKSFIPHSLAKMTERLELDISLQKEGVNAMIRLAGYSISQLTRLMKRYYNTTPHEYLKALRLATSLKLVAETNISLESISYECGYHCYGYFTNIFKEKFGMTPADFRNSKTQKQT